ncbi:hypothetical protein ACM66B_000153 [Microbotryomycetes sp. NB124-2]
MGLFIPTYSKATAQDMAKLFIQHVFSKHGVPSSLVSDRGSLFTTAYHPRTDGQTERVNQVSEQYLRIYVNYNQDNWVDWLPLAEFAYNNAPHSTTTITPFFANKGNHPTLEVQLEQSTGTTFASDLSNLEKIHRHCQEEIKKANEAYVAAANADRQPFPLLSKGDRVWISTKNMKTTRPTPKLSERYIGPYLIDKQISPVACRISLPSHLSALHPVFHASLLEPHRENNIDGRHQAPPPPVKIDEQPEWVVKAVLDSKRTGKTVKYLVKWLGYDNTDEARTWEPYKNLRCDDLLKKFHTQSPQKPRARKFSRHFVY